MVIADETRAAAATSLPVRIVNVIRSVVGPGRVALHEPRFVGNEWKYVKECLDTTFVSSVGHFVDRFERDLADLTGVRRAVACGSGICSRSHKSFGNSIACFGQSHP